MATQPVPPDTLRALVRLAAVVTTSQEPAALIEGVAEAAQELLAADSLSISRFDATSGLLRTLINVGDVGLGEQRWPVNETYRVADFPDTLGFLTGHPVRHLATCVDDAVAEPAEVELLLALGKRSSLKAPILVDGAVWGELWAARGTRRHQFTETDGGLAEVIAALVSAGLAQASAWQQLHSLAVSDPMTGLANRRALDEHLTRHVARCAALRLPMAVAVADLNGLKRVNDRYGHAAGDDAILRAGEAATRAAQRITDAMAARLGGDEFALVLPGVTQQQAVEIARAWCDGAAHHDYGTSLACGLAVVTPEDADVIDGPAETAASVMLRAADRAQYVAKRDGHREPWLARPADWGRPGRAARR